MGIPVHKDELREVAELSGVMDGFVLDLNDFKIQKEYFACSSATFL